MSLPTNGGTDRGDFGPVAALATHSFPLLPRARPLPPSYSISRSQIVASSANVHGLSRKRSHSGESLSAQSVGTPPRIAFAAPRVSFASSSAPPVSLTGPSSAVATAVGPVAAAASQSPSIRCQVPAPPSAKRLRREPLSPTSVGEVSDAKKLPPAKTAVAASPGAAQMQSMLRGLQHLSTCSSSGCCNPLCVSTRAFVDKVKTHRSSMAGKATHDENRCGACKLWGAIVRAHAPTCSAGALCRVPGCSRSRDFSCA
ncbi:hypothetical protein PR003_g5090 [Phytophthora rubi]|uniref:Uncharacterized protein n=1 Tax=Phytophthora rubi TaxID=129364 RepID=A0A6A3NDK6_9STRA|nr:hypothetical protein PR002_g5139 [Phytophthora rubi]KAE9045527.1 hypothetical protein PR001_g4931 [Phytophthora rubi]KAE9351013.1 hypothetical protein PR003_g5090 [Phytophthora rubi]